MKIKIAQVSYVFIAICLAGSLWSIWEDRHCGQCNEAARLVGGINFGVLGALYYGLLLAIALLLSNRFKKPVFAISSVLPAGLIIAGATHLVLLTLLLKNRTVCPPCLLIGVSAMCGMVSCLAQNRVWCFRSLLIVPVVSLAVIGGIKTSRVRADRDFTRESKRAASIVSAEKHTLPAGTAYVVVFTKEKCPACAKFKSSVLPVIEREFSDRILIEERPAWRGMLTPTTVVLGAKEALLIGYKPVDELRSAIRAASGMGATSSHGGSAIAQRRQEF